MAILYESDADPNALQDARVAIVGYGNQGRSWALNLRDSGSTPMVCVRADESKAQATEDGFEVADIPSAAVADLVCLLVPDDAIPELGIDYSPESTVVVASGYTPAFDRLEVSGDIVMIAPRMLGSEVRAGYLDGSGFITAIGVVQDRTGAARGRMLALATAIGGLKRGGIEMTAAQEAVLDLSVEQLLSPVLTHVNQAFVTVMIEQGIPLEAVLCELYLSGEVERNYRLLREEGFVAQLDRHSPTSQYGQLSRRGRFDDLDVAEIMRALVVEITSGSFADEWDRERDTGHRSLAELRDVHASAVQADFENAVRESFELR
ncbi:MAG: ketol-acid reductoisomerase [Microthrixaceae bacterium]